MAGYRGGYGGFGGGFGGGNQMQNLMKQAQKMQEEMQKAQAELEELEVEGSAGGGLVKSVWDKGQDVVIPANAAIELVFTQPITTTASPYGHEN